MAKKKWTILELAGVGGVLYLAATYLADYFLREISFGVPTINFGALSWQGVDVEIDLPITNNTSLPIPIDYLNGHIAYGPYVLAPFELPQSVTIAARDTTVLKLRSQINTADLSGNLAALITDGNFLQALQIRGMARIKQVNIPFSNTISVG